MAITPKSEDKYVEKCSTAQSFIQTEMSTYRIGTLTGISMAQMLLVNKLDCLILNQQLVSKNNLTKVNEYQFHALNSKF